MHIGMSNDFYRPTKIASCAPGFSQRLFINLAHIITVRLHGPWSRSVVTVRGHGPWSRSVVFLPNPPIAISNLPY
jgi:hypothetical protein